MCYLISGSCDVDDTKLSMVPVTSPGQMVIKQEPSMLPTVSEDEENLGSIATIYMDPLSCEGVKLKSINNEVNIDCSEKLTITSVESVTSLELTSSSSSDQISLFDGGQLNSDTSGTWVGPHSAQSTIKTLKPFYSIFSTEILSTLSLIRRCPYCNLVISHVAGLIYHINVHSTTGKTYNCSQEGCIQALGGAYKLFAHLIDAHMSELIIGCFICDKLLSTVEAVKSHIDNHASACLLCGANFNYSYMLQDHINDQHCNTEGNLSCTYCDYNISKKGSTIFRYHVREHYGIANCKCKLCGLWFDNRKALVSHLKSMHTSSTSFQCPRCTVYYTQSALGMVQHWFNGCGKIRCELCKEAYFNNAGSVFYHQQACGKKQQLPHECNKCTRRFRAKHHLHSHIAIHHDKSTGFPCLNEGCGYMAPTTQRRKLHMLCCQQTAIVGNNKADLSQNMFKEVLWCRYPGCEFLALAESDLKNHVGNQHKNHRRQHPRKHKCDKCGTLVTENYNLKRHKVVVHNEPSNFHCEPCQLYFISQSVLDKHMYSSHDNVEKSGKTEVPMAPTGCDSDSRQHNHQFNCTKCDYYTHSLHRFLKHKSSRVHKGKQFARNAVNFKPKKCPLCSFVTNRNSCTDSLERHLFVHYRRGEKIPDGYTVSIHECPLCDHKTVDTSHLKRHLVVHLKRGESLPPPYHVLQLKGT